jgi:hypothetical protein
MNTHPETIQVMCSTCNQLHPAEYHHEGQYGEGPIYISTCPSDWLADFYTLEASV